MGSNIAKLVGILAITGLVTACSGVTPAGSSAAVGTVAPSASADTTLVADLDVGGRTMHIVCVGPTDTDRPTVIFESGLGGDFGVWGDVLGKLQATDRGCSYDRAGIGLSEQAPTPRTTSTQVDDVRALLTAAGVQPPYVLVGHSLGGWNAMVHADRHPDDVAGAVMVDVRPPTATARWLAELPPESSSDSDLLRQYREDYTAFESDATRNPEGLLLAKSAIEAESSAGFGDKPLIVLAAADTSDGEGSDLDPSLAATFDSIWWELQEAMATRSTAGRLERVDRTGHDIPFERPDAILDAIKSILGSTGS